MPEWPEELMAGLDGPRPLPAELRARLEHALAAQAPPGRPLGEALSARLEDALADPLAGSLAAALADAEQPRPLRPATKRHIAKALGEGRRSWVPGAAVAAGVLVLGGVGLGLGLSVTGAGPSVSGRAALPTAHSGGAATNAAPSSVSAPATTATNPFSASGAVSSGSAAAQSQPLTALPNAAAAPAGPEIGGVDPAGGPSAGGNWVAITGSGLAGTTGVEFGTTPAPFEVVSGTELRALAPAHAAGTVDVRVSAAGGTSPVGLADHYTYQ